MGSGMSVICCPNPEADGPLWFRVSNAVKHRKVGDARTRKGRRL